MNKYLKLLESELAESHMREKELRKDLEFYRGKCERLELALATLRNGGITPMTGFPGVMAERPPLEKVEISGRKSFADLKREWSALTEEQQEKIVAEGKWEVQDAGQ